MKISLFFFAGAFALFSLFLFKTDRFFLKKNGGFCIHHIYSSQDFVEKKEVEKPDDIDDIINQKFTYLTRGHQSYVFLSEDNQYVIKFYRFPSHLRPFSLSPRWLANCFSPKRKEVEEYNLQKLQASFESYKIAYEELKKETGLVFVHLNSTQSIQKKLTVIDRLGHSYKIDLDSAYFLIQKKAALIFPTLEQLLEKDDLPAAKKILSQIVQLVITRCKKGIQDHDAVLEKNYGVLFGRAIHIDVGRFSKDPLTNDPIFYKKEIFKVTASLQRWLQARSPELFTYFQEELNSIK